MLLLTTAVGLFMSFVLVARIKVKALTDHFLKNTNNVLVIKESFVHGDLEAYFEAEDEAETGQTVLKTYCMYIT